MNLSSVLSDIHKQVKEALLKTTEKKLHDLKPGKWIVVKDLRGEKNGEHEGGTALTKCSSPRKRQ